MTTPDTRRALSDMAGEASTSADQPGPPDTLLALDSKTPASGDMAEGIKTSTETPDTLTPATGRRNTTEEIASTDESGDSSTVSSKYPPEKPNLHTLAQELFDLITAEMNLEDLRNLRLVSTGVNAKAMDTFAKAHFTDYSFLMNNQESLDTACKVAAHPVFGPTIRNLMVSVEQLSVLYFHGRPWYIHDVDDEEEYILCGDRRTLLRQLEHLTRRTRAFYKMKVIPNSCSKAIDRMFKAIEAQDEFVRSGRQLELLNMVFRSLKKSDRFKELK